MNARKAFDDQLTQDAHLRSIARIYASAIEHRHTDHAQTRSQRC
jgi:hypothetical protein